MTINYQAWSAKAVDRLALEFVEESLFRWQGKEGIRRLSLCEHDGLGQLRSTLLRIWIVLDVLRPSGPQLNFNIDWPSLVEDKIDTVV